MTVVERAAAPSLRDCLLDLLADYDHAERGTEDRYLAAYLRGCLSALDATRQRVSRGLRRSAEPTRWSAPIAGGAHRPVSTAVMYLDNPRPEATAELVRMRTIAHTNHRVAERGEAS